MQERDKARTFGQDLMRGEHILGASAKVDPTPIAGGLTIGALATQYTGKGGELPGAGEEQTGTSIFDPVLCELAYRWFSPPDALVLDPFAGGSVRGIVASKLGRRYVGIDLRPEQLAANEAQARIICDRALPAWLVGDSTDIDQLAAGLEADFVFSCPPYADLEVYSDDPRDLSTMDYAQFRAQLALIIRKTCTLLKQDRFACFIVGDVRDAAGAYYGLPGHTIEAFVAAGLPLYNHAILVTAVGSLPVRVRKQFESSRKLGTTHQHMLVFIKGDARRATQACGPVEFGELTEAAPTPGAPTNGQGHAMLAPAPALPGVEEL